MANMQNASEKALHLAVAEFLAQRGFHETLESFKAECPEVETVSIPDGSSSDLADALDMLLPAMKRGDFDNFFDKWHSVISNTDLVDAEVQNLEFYLNIYFAIYPIIVDNKDAAATAMARFKTYIDSGAGAKLSQKTEFLPYYALPFVADPKTHPSFESIFETNWIPDIQRRVEQLLQGDKHDSNVNRSTLLDLWSKRDALSSAGGSHSRAPQDSHKEVAALQEQLIQCEQQEMELMGQHHRLQKNYHTLIGTAAELVEALEASIQGTPVGPEYLIRIVSQLNAFSSVSASQVLDPTASATLRTSVSQQFGNTYSFPSVGSSIMDGNFPSHGNVHASVLSASMVVAPLPPLDAARVRKDLLSLSDRNTSLLLQALRWRVTRSHPGAQRDAVVSEFASHDYLGIRSPPGGPMYQLFKSTSAHVREYTTRLLNCLASLARGRAYVLSRPVVVALVDELVAEESDTMVRQNILGTLQKLSLRRKAQTVMIEQGVISWLHQTLLSRADLCEYSIEYAVALLMNLCLRSAGRAFCVTACPGVVALLKDMLAHEDNTQVRSYIHGALYSLLGNAVMRKTALSVGIDAVIKQRLADSDEEMSMQLEYILRLVQNTDVGADGAADTDDENAMSDDDDDVDDVDDESDDLTACDESEGETLVVPPGSATRVGEQLLCTEYLAHGRIRSARDPTQSAHVAVSAVAPPPPPTNALPVLFRPSTPTLRPSATPTTSNGTTTAAQRPPRSARSREGRQRDTTRPPGSGAGRPPSSRRSTATGSRARSRSGLSSAHADTTASRTSTSRGSSAGHSRHGRHGNADNNTNSNNDDDDEEATARTPQPPPKVVSPPPPSQKVLAAVAKDLGKAGKQTAVDIGEYNNIFSTRPKVPRTPNGLQ